MSASFNQSNGILTKLDVMNLFSEITINERLAFIDQEFVENCQDETGW